MANFNYILSLENILMGFNLLEFETCAYLKQILLNHKYQELASTALWGGIHVIMPFQSISLD